MDYLIRLAVPEDAPAIATTHIRSWQETYPGIMPQRKIESLSQERSTRNWQNAIETCDAVFVAEADGHIVGFVSGGKNRSQEGCETGLASACDGELAAMYLLKAYQGRGIGKALTEVFSQRLRDLGYISMVAWVAEKNPSTGFYQSMGGQVIDRKILIVCEEEIPVIAYRYEL